jgi:hypothetical protein
MPYSIWLDWSQSRQKGTEVNDEEYRIEGQGRG